MSAHVRSGILNYIDKQVILSLHSIISAQAITNHMSQCYILCSFIHIYPPHLIFFLINMGGYSYACICSSVYVPSLNLFQLTNVTHTHLHPILWMSPSPNVFKPTYVVTHALLDDLPCMCPYLIYSS